MKTINNIESVLSEIRDSIQTIKVEISKIKSTLPTPEFQSPSSPSPNTKRVNELVVTTPEGNLIARPTQSTHSQRHLKQWA